MKINGIEEEDLIRRLFEGDQISFEILFRFYYPGLVVFARQIILDVDEAEEIVQDFFVQLWIKRKKIKASSSLKSYFFTSIKNRSLNFLKKEKIKKKTMQELKCLRETNLLYQPDIFVKSELQIKIDKVLKKLPKRTFEIFDLSRNKGLTNDEIAIELNLSKRTVETQISNALKILRTELKECKLVLLVLGFGSFL